MAHDVFISYASSDKVVADAVCSQLESIHRIRCWIAPRDVTPGASWAESIIDALDGSRIMVLIFSSNANASMQIEREVERAVHKGINIIPLRIENAMPTKTLEYFISAPHWLDALSTPLESHINKLAASVKALLAKQAPTITPQSVDRILPAAPLSATPSAVTVSKAAPQQRSTLVPMLILAVVAAGGVGFGIRSSFRPPQNSMRGPASVATPATAIPASAPVVPKSAVATAMPPTTASNPAAATATSALPAPIAKPSPGAPEENPAGVAAARNPSLFIELANNLSEGTLTLEVDGQKTWTQKLGANAKGGAVNLAKGPHKATVTLLNPEGKMKETKTTSLNVEPGKPLTLRVRLSRFKKDLELQTQVGKPVTKEAAVPAKASAVSDAKTNAAASKPVAGKP